MIKEGENLAKNLKRSANKFKRRIWKAGILENEKILSQNVCCFEIHHLRIVSSKKDYAFFEKELNTLSLITSFSSFKIWTLEFGPIVVVGFQWFACTY